MLAARVVLRLWGHCGYKILVSMHGLKVSCYTSRMFFLLPVLQTPCSLRIENGIWFARTFAHRFRFSSSFTLPSPAWIVSALDSHFASLRIPSVSSAGSRLSLYYLFFSERTYMHVILLNCPSILPGRAACLFDSYIFNFKDSSSRPSVLQIPHLLIAHSQCIECP